MAQKRSKNSSGSASFKIITFEANHDDDATRAQHEIEDLVQKGWTLVRATAPENDSPGVVLLERN